MRASMIPSSCAVNLVCFPPFLSLSCGTMIGHIFWHQLARVVLSPTGGCPFPNALPLASYSLCRHLSSVI